MITRLFLLCVGLAALAPAQGQLFRTLDNSLPHDLDAAGDFDADGDVDLLSRTGVLINDGHGRFSAPAPTTLPATMLPRKAADLNGDGIADVVATFPSLSLQIFLSSAGLFVPGQSLPGGLPGSNLVTRDFALGDVDGDGDTDLLVGTADMATGALGKPTLWLNDGIGGMTLAPTTGLPPLPYEIVVLRDLDGDGDLDAIFADALAGAATTMGIVYATNAGGVFTLAAAALWPGFLYGFEIGHFDNDALPDFIVAIGGAAAVIRNSPAGFTAPVITPRPVNWADYAALDLDGDGIDEVLEASHPRTLVAMRVLPGGLLGSATQVASDLGLRPASTVAPVVRDLDADGDRDVVAFRLGEAVTLMNAGNGSLFRAGGRVTNVALDAAAAHHVLDVDGDGDPDVLGRSEGASAIAIGLNDGDGFFSACPITPVGAPFTYYNFHPFDRDGDGDADVYATLQNYGAPLPPPVDLVFDNSGGAFALSSTVPGIGDARGFLTADFDADGDLDVVMGRWNDSLPQTGPMSYVANLGPAGFAAPVFVGANHRNFDVDLGDFDGDGTIDVFQTNQAAPSSPVFDSSVVYLNSGTGVFTAVTMTGVSGAFTVAGDLNADGMTDLVMDSQVWFSIGGGSFLPGPTLPSGLGSPGSLADVDLDGDLDLVETPATVMFNLGGAVFGVPVEYRPRAYASWDAVEIPQTAVADVDRDGDPDLVAEGPLVITNATRQLASRSIPRPARPASVEVYGSANGAWFLFGSSGTTVFPFPPWGTVLIDPATAQLGGMGTFGVGGIATFGVTVPNNPALIGATTYWQAIDATQIRFTNRLRITVEGY